MPERESRIIISEVAFNPKFFSFQALREISRFQIYNSVGLRSVHMRMPENEEFYIPSYDLRDYRCFFGEERREILDWLADKMQHAEEVVIKGSFSAKDQEDIKKLERLKLPEQPNVFRKYINEGLAQIDDL
ncbi:MAG: hypothetical protein Q7K55_01900 [Candidatus Levybacteria bacterium]|nr:hypothetical protein [Candidatus Levybacteria bacterium]